MAGDAQWTAFCHAVRLEMLSALDGLGEASVAEMALAIDRSADGLYRHVRILERAGLVEAVGSRRVGRQTEAVYRVVAQETLLDADARDPEGQVRMLEVARMIQRECQRSFKESLEADRCRNGDDDRNTWLRASTAWLDEEDLQQLGRMLEELDAFMSARQCRKSGALHRATYTVAPVYRSRGFDARGSQRQDDMRAGAEARESPTS